ncbi:hypothetical protein I600_2409 [Maribacter dokdonensis DSW-8]|nr:hypothetical protein I600_2409 [Maribacter dokdonensis DSW-8]
MEFFQFLNGNLVFPILALFVLVIYFVNKVRAKRKYKR